MKPVGKTRNWWNFLAKWCSRGLYWHTSLWQTDRWNTSHEAIIQPFETVLINWASRNPGGLFIINYEAPPPTSSVCPFPSPKHLPFPPRSYIRPHPESLTPWLYSLWYHIKYWFHLLAFLSDAGRPLASDFQSAIVRARVPSLNKRRRATAKGALARETYWKTGRPHS